MTPMPDNPTTPAATWEAGEQDLPRVVTTKTNPTIPAAAVAGDWTPHHLLAFLDALASDMEAGRPISGMRLVWQVIGHASQLRAHLAAPADVAALVARFRAGEPCHPPCKVMDARSGCICAEAADRLTAIAADRDEHKRAAERLDVKLFAFTGRAIKAEAERDEARRHIVVFKDNLKVAREANCALEAERDALAERLRVVERALTEAVLRGCDHCADNLRDARHTLTQASAPETGEYPDGKSDGTYVTDAARYPG